RPRPALGGVEAAHDLSHDGSGELPVVLPLSLGSEHLDEERLTEAGSQQQPGDVWCGGAGRDAAVPLLAPEVLLHLGEGFHRPRSGLGELQTLLPEQLALGHDAAGHRDDGAVELERGLRELAEVPLDRSGAGAFGEGRHQIDERGEPALGDLDEQGVLVREVSIDAALGAPGALGDDPGRGVAHADLADEVLGGAQDLLPRVVRRRSRLGGHHAAPANSSPCAPTWLRTKTADTTLASTMNPTATYSATCMACTKGWGIEP